MKDIAYKCMDCGLINVSRYDGHKCYKCNGYLIPVGEAILLDKKKHITPEQIYSQIENLEKTFQEFISIENRKTL